MPKSAFASRSVANTPKIATSWSVMQFSLFGGHQRSEGKPRRRHRGGHGAVSAVWSNEGALWGEAEKTTSDILWKSNAEFAVLKQLHRS